METFFQFRGLLWLILALGPLLFLQRWLHNSIQTIFYLLTRRVDLAMTLFSLLFFPGVLLHEGSHYLTARLLGVHTGRFSVIPRPMPDGRLQLGYVETASADPLRETLIGAAPLIAGGLFVAFVGLNRLDMLSGWQLARASGLSGLFAALGDLIAQPDFWLWFYLLFTVSSTMLPSASDRQAWLPLALVAAGLLGISLLAGAGPWLLANLAPLFNRLVFSATLIFLISDFTHLALLLPVFLIQKFTQFLYVSPSRR